jgi:hypothetical protein
MLLMIVAALVYGGNGLDVQATVGFQGYYRAGSWTPVRVTVTNLGQPITGDLSVETERGERLGTGRYPVAYSRRIELAQSARKTYSFVVPLESAVYPITVSVTDGDRLAHTESFDLAGRSVPGRFVVVLARRPNLDFLLPLYNTPGERALDIVYPLPEHLPDQWQGYEAVDTVVAHDGRIGDMSRTQATALLEWVAAGGRLIVSGGAHFGAPQSHLLLPLGDFTATGAAPAKVGETGFTELGLPVPIRERDATVLATTFSRHGSAITRLPVGRGELVVLPVDYAELVRVAPLTSIGLWNALLEPRPPDARIATTLRRRVYETDLLANQLTLPIYRFPSRRMVAGFAGMYVAGAAGILIWLASGRTRLRRWLGGPAIALVIITTAAGGHAALTAGMQPVGALALTVEQAALTPGGGHAVVTRETALFSRQAASYEVGYAGLPVLVPMAQREHSVAIETDRLTQRLQVDRWGYQNNLALQVMPLAIHTSVRSGRDFVEVQVANDTDQRISHLVLLRNGFPEPMGNLDPGSMVEHLSTGPSGGSFQSIAWEDYVPADTLQINRARFVGDIARRQRFDGGTPADLIVVGWSERPLLPVSIEPAFRLTVDLHVVVIAFRPEGDER